MACAAAGVGAGPNADVNAVPEEPKQSIHERCWAPVDWQPSDGLPGKGEWFKVADGTNEKVHTKTNHIYINTGLSSLSFAEYKFDPVAQVSVVDIIKYVHSSTPPWRPTALFREVVGNFVVSLRVADECKHVRVVGSLITGREVYNALYPWRKPLTVANVKEELIKVLTNTGEMTAATELKVIHGDVLPRGNVRLWSPVNGAISNDKKKKRPIAMSEASNPITKYMKMD